MSYSELDRQVDATAHGLVRLGVGVGDRVRVVVCEGDVDGVPTLQQIGLDGVAFIAREMQPEDPAAILYTSGTTARQKGATLSRGNLVSNTFGAVHTEGITPDDRLMLGSLGDIGYMDLAPEVEEVLFQHPSIKECAVVGLADLEKGDIRAAYLVLREGASLTPEEFDAYCRKHLAAYKVSRQVQFVDSLPKNATARS